MKLCTVIALLLIPITLQAQVLATIPPPVIIPVQQPAPDHALRNVGIIAAATAVVVLTTVYVVKAIHKHHDKSLPAGRPAISTWIPPKGEICHWEEGNLIHAWQPRADGICYLSDDLKRH